MWLSLQKCPWGENKTWSIILIDELSYQLHYQECNCHLERVENDRILCYLDTLVSPQMLLLLFSPVCSHELSLLSGGFTRSQVSKAVNILNMVLSCELGYVQLGYNVLSFNQLGNALRRQRQSKGTLRLNQVRVQECWHIPLVCPYNRLVDSAPVNMGGWLVSVLHCLFEHNIESLFLEHCMPIILSSLTSVSLENSLFIL